MSRLYGRGLPIEVEMDAHGLPVTFIFNGRLYQITHIAERWRVDEGWWAERERREYYKVTVNEAALLLFRDDGDGRWYVQRVYD